MNRMNDDKYVDLSIQWNRWLMKPMGLWPMSHKISLQEKTFIFLINIICYSLISIVFVPCGLYMVLEVEDLYTKLKFCGPLIFCLMAYVKYSCLITYSRHIRECIEQIEWDWRNISYVKDRDIMIANATFGKRLVVFCSLFMCSGFAFYNIAVPITVGKMVAEDMNFTFIPIAFPLPKYIVDVRRSPTNEIFFSIQLFGSAVVHAIGAVACNLAVAFAVHACGQIEVLICWLDHLIDGREDMHMNVNKRIARVVNQHVRILKFLSLTDSAIKQVSLVEFLGSTIDLCLLGYYILVEWASNNVTSTITYVTILVSFTFNIFIYCYIGELVAERWTMIGKKSYMSNWYEVLGKQKLSFLLIIAMSNTSKKLTAGNVIELSLESFTSVMKTTFAFFNMLRTLT